MIPSRIELPQLAERRNLKMEVVSQAPIDALCPQLRAILDAEVAAGNRICETSKGWPTPSSIVIFLSDSFKVTLGALPSNVTYRLLNDPHYWYAEYEHSLAGHVLACGFR